MKGKTITVTVRYWRGTIPFVGRAKTYAGALRIAARNRNAGNPARFYDEQGRELFDVGGGLAYPPEAGQTVVECVL